MRSRNIKPGFFTNELLAKIDPLGRILFAGLWCLADRRGRLECRPERIKAEVLPYDKAKVDPLIDSLEHLGFIFTYDANSKRYIQIINFENHQHPHVKEPESTIPAPDLHQTSTSTARLIPDSGFLIPDSGLSDSHALQHVPVQAPDFNFLDLWKRYPKKIGKPLAERAFRKTVKTETDWRAINKALDNYLAHLKAEDTDRKFIKHGSTWFNQWPGWTEEALHGANDNASVPSLKDELRAKREAEKARNGTPTGEIFTGIRNPEDVPTRGG